LSDRDNASIIFTGWSFILTCCCGCCCCCNCCNRKKLFPSIVKQLYGLFQILNRFLVKTLFGPKEGIFERFAEHRNDEEDKHGNPEIYLRNRRLTYREVSILAILITSFGLLAAITAWDSYFLDTSYICSVLPGVHCFPIALDFDAEDEFNITVSQKKRITDCSYWTSENVSSRVSFSCFKWELDTKAVISDVGGLLTMFIITMKIAVSGSLALLKWAIKKYSPKTGTMDGRGLYYYTDTIDRYRRRRIRWIEIVAVIEIGMGVLLIVMTVFAISRNNAIIDFFYEHGNQFLLIIGIFSSLLLLPLEEYAMYNELDPTDRENIIQLPPEEFEENNEIVPPTGNHDERTCTTIYTGK
jgi:hypothetical protein